MAIPSQSASRRRPIEKLLQKSLHLVEATYKTCITRPTKARHVGSVAGPLRAGADATPASSSIADVDLFWVRVSAHRGRHFRLVVGGISA